MAININEGAPGATLQAAIKAQMLENADAGFPILIQSGATVTLTTAMTGYNVHLTNASPTLEIPTGLTQDNVFIVSSVNAAVISALTGVTMNSIAGPTTLSLAANGSGSIRVVAANSVFVPTGGVS